MRKQQFGLLFIPHRLYMPQSLKNSWNRCLELIKSNVGADHFKTWFACAQMVSLENDTLTLRLPSEFFVDHYETTFYSLLRFAINKVFGSNVKLEYVYNIVSNDEGSQIKKPSLDRSHTIDNKLTRQIEKAPAKELASNFDPQLNPALTFENYCVGKSNQLAFTIAEHIANHPEKREFNPFFVYGNVGVGKTHLIQGIGIRIKERNPQARVLFITIRQFQNLYQHATIEHKIPDFINWYQSMDVILFDDLQELSGKKGTIEALFPIFNHLHQHNKKLVFSCDRPPMELDGISDRMIDRFKWGITEKLPNPDFELRKQILHFKADRNGLDLSDEIINLIAASSDSSVRELEGIVMGLYTRSITTNAPITIDLAKEVLANFVKVQVKKTVNFDMIVETTAEYYGLNPDVIFSKSRYRDIADARQMIMYLCSKHTSLSTPAIGAKLNREHSTVIYGISSVKDRLACNKETVDMLSAIEESLLR